jgi:hypothetical protein
LSKGVKPPPFDGSKVIDWIFKITQYLEIVDDTATERERILFSANLLTGKALTWWRHKITNENPHYNLFAEFLNDIHEHFVDTDLVNRLRD